jgi:hypothetical protein
LQRLTLALSLIGMFVFGAMAVGGELVIPVTALTFAIWGFAGVMVLWDSRRSFQGFLITVPMMLPFVFAPHLRIFALVGLWGALLAYMAHLVHQREKSNPDLAP